MPVLIGHSVCVRLWTKHFTCVKSFAPSNGAWDMSACHLHFNAKEVEPAWLRNLPKVV